MLMKRFTCPRGFKFPRSSVGREICLLPKPLDLNLAKRVMVFAPHPDDETLGCGGTLAQLARHAEVCVVLVTDGAGAGGLPPGADLDRQQEFVEALQILGIQDYRHLYFQDGSFLDNPLSRSAIQKLLGEYQPNWVFLPSPWDYHSDHINISSAVESAARQQRSVDTLLFFETWAPCLASHVVDITDWVDLKLKALACHQTALACGDYDRAILGLNHYRGLYLGRNRSAEAFLVLSIKGTSAITRRLRSFLSSILGVMEKP